MISLHLSPCILKGERRPDVSRGLVVGHGTFNLMLVNSGVEQAVKSGGWYSPWQGDMQVWLLGTPMGTWLSLVDASHPKASWGIFGQPTAHQRRGSLLLPCLFHAPPHQALSIAALLPRAQTNKKIMQSIHSNTRYFFNACQATCFSSDSYSFLLVLNPILVCTRLRHGGKNCVWMHLSHGWEIPAKTPASLWNAQVNPSFICQGQNFCQSSDGKRDPLFPYFCNSKISSLVFKKALL